MRSSGSRLSMSTWALNQGWDRKGRARRGTCIVGAVRELDPEDKATGLHVGEVEGKVWENA